MLAQLEILKEKVEKEDAKWLHLIKEKEKITMNSLFERDALLRRMALLQEQNRKLEDMSTSLYSYFFGGIGAMKSKVQEYKYSLQQYEGPVIV